MLGTPASERGKKSLCRKGNKEKSFAPCRGDRTIVSKGKRGTDGRRQWSQYLENGCYLSILHSGVAGQVVRGAIITEEGLVLYIACEKMSFPPRNKTSFNLGITWKPIKRFIKLIPSHNVPADLAGLFLEYSTKTRHDWRTEWLKLPAALLKPPNRKLRVYKRLLLFF